MSSQHHRTQTSGTSENPENPKNGASSDVFANVRLGEEAERLEELAALADGSLDDARRPEVLARLVDDPEELDLLAEVSALALEMEAVREPHPAELEPMPENVVRGPWRRRAWMVATALAALLALVVVVPRLLSPPEPTPQTLVAQLETPSLASSGVLAELPWSPLRGTGDAGGLEVAGPRESFRWGVLAVDLEAALRAGDPASRRRLGPEFARVVPSVLGFTYDGLTDPETAAGEALAVHAELQSEILPLVQPFYYRYGAWSRAAWLAARSGQMDFFRGPAARTLAALEPPESLRPQWQEARDRLGELETEEDLDELARFLAQVLERHAG